MKVKLDAGAYMPERAHETDAGYDLRAREVHIVRPYSSAVIDTGAHMGCVGERSGEHDRLEVMTWAKTELSPC